MTPRNSVKFRRFTSCDTIGQVVNFRSCQALVMAHRCHMHDDSIKLIACTKLIKLWITQTGGIARSKPYKHVNRVYAII